MFESADLNSGPDDFENMFEHQQEPLLPRRKFLRRVARSLTIAAGIIGISLGIGILGYHWLEKLSWIDSLLNASMILTGMGPIHQPQTTVGKLFASFYALFSGVIFLTVAGVL